MKNRYSYKWFLSLVWASVLFFVCSFSAFAEDDAFDSMSLSLDQALKLGVENNANIVLAQLAVDSDKINVEQTAFQALKLKKSINDAEVHVPINQDVYYVLDIRPAKAELDYELAQATLDYTTNYVKYGIETAYYSLKVAEKALEAAELSVERNETQLSNVKAKIEQGMASKLDLFSAESNYLSSQADYAETKKGANYAAMILNKLLGLDVTTELKLTDGPSLPERKYIDVDKAIKNALETDITYLTAKSTYNIAVLMGDYTQKFTAANTFDYKQANVSKKQAEAACNDAKTDLEIRVRYAYNELNISLLNYNSLSTSLELANEAYRMAELRYKSGLATIYDVENAEASLQQANAGLLNAEKDYDLAVIAFQYGVFPDHDDDNDND